MEIWGTERSYQRTGTNTSLLFVTLFSKEVRKAIKNSQDYIHSVKSQNFLTLQFCGKQGRGTMPFTALALGGAGWLSGWSRAGEPELLSYSGHTDTLTHTRTCCNFSPLGWEMDFRLIPGLFAWWIKENPPQSFTAHRPSPASLRVMTLPCNSFSHLLLSQERLPAP